MHSNKERRLAPYSMKLDKRSSAESRFSKNAYQILLNLSKFSLSNGFKISMTRSNALKT